MLRTNRPQCPLADTRPPSASLPPKSNDLSDQIAGQTVSDENDRWFKDICSALLPKDAGFALHVATGFEERSCYRYAAADRKPPGYFIRALLRSEGGWQWLCALMEGSDAAWFRDLDRARRIADAVSKIT